MPTPRPVSSAAAAAALLLAVPGCSIFDRGPDSGEDRSAPQVSVTAAPSRSTASPAASPTQTSSVSTVRDICARAGEAARGAQDKLREDPRGLLAEIDDIAETAPPELSEQISSVRDAVDGYRKGERSYFSVLREARALQERCSA